MMHHEKEAQVPGCTPEYCVKPDVKDKDQETPGPEEEIRIISNVMLESKIIIPVSPRKKD
jgi:hypothetical protein